MRGVPGRRVLIASIAFALAAFLLRLGVEAPDHGYTRYATIAFEMVRSGDWIAPRLDSRLYVDKPPFAIWLIAVPMALTNVPASLVQHAPNLVALLLSVLFLQRLGARIFARRDAGWLAAGIYLSALLPFALLRDKRIDPLFAALLLGALDFFHAALTLHAPSRRRLAQWLASAVFLAAATLTKGPLAVVFFAAVALVYAAWTRRLADLATREVLAAAVLFVVLAGLWPLAMLGSVGMDAWLTRVGERPMISRFAGPLHYLWSLPMRAAPWSLLLPALALAWRPLLRGAPAAALRLPLTWFGVIFLLLHVTSAKHARYLLPAFPAFALILVAIWIVPGTGAIATLGTRARQWRDGVLAIVLGLGVIGGAALPVAPWLRPTARALWPALLLGGALAIWISIEGLRLLRGRSDGIAALARAVVAALLIEAGVDLVRSGDFLVDDAFRTARLALSRTDLSAPLITVGVGGGPRNALLFATGRPAVEGLDIEDAQRFTRERGGALVVTTDATLGRLRADPHLVVGEAVPLRLAGDALLLAPLRSAASP